MRSEWCESAGFPSRLFHTHENNTSFIFLQPHCIAADSPTMSQCVYYGQINKNDAERLLEKYGKDGSFLLRDSQSVRGALCLCVRKTPFVHTYRIVHSSQGWAAETESREKLQWFKSLNKLIECYRKPDMTPHNMVPLLYPLEKTNLTKEESSYPEEPAYMEI